MNFPVELDEWIENPESVRMEMLIATCMAYSHSIRCPPSE